MSTIHIEDSATGLDDSALSYQNALAIGALFWSTERSDGWAMNALGPQTNDYWIPTAVPAYIGAQLATAMKCDIAALIGHTCGTSGNTIKVQASTNGTAWVTMAEATPADNSDLFFLFDDAQERSFAYWRFLISGGSAPSISIAWIGPKLYIPFGTSSGYTPLSLALNIDTTTNQTRGGQYLGTRIDRRGASTSIPLASQERWWVQEEFTPFIAHYNEGLPFLWLPEPNLLPTDAHYCWRTGPALQGSWSAGSQWIDFTLEVGAYVSS